jgi:hypothetical protein
MKSERMMKLTTSEIRSIVRKTLEEMKLGLASSRFPERSLDEPEPKNPMYLPRKEPDYRHFPDANAMHNDDWKRQWSAKNVSQPKISNAFQSLYDFIFPGEDSGDEEYEHVEDYEIADDLKRVETRQRKGNALNEFISLILESMCPGCGDKGAHVGLYAVECGNTECKFFSQKQFDLNTDIDKTELEQPKDISWGAWSEPRMPLSAQEVKNRFPDAWYEWHDKYTRSSRSAANHFTEDSNGVLGVETGPDDPPWLWDKLQKRWNQETNS